MLKINKTAILLKKNSRWVSATGRLMIPMAIFAGLLFLLGPDVEISAPDAMRDIEGEQAPYASMTHTSDAEGNATRLDVPVRLRLTAAPGDTLMAMLVDEGIERREAHAAIIAMSKIFKPQNLRPKQDVFITARLALDTDQPSHLLRLELAASVERDIVVSRRGDGAYGAVAIDRQLTRNFAYAKGNIDTSLYAAAVDAEVPLPVLADLIQIFSFDVDFQRDIRRDDQFSLMYTRYSDDTGTVLRHGEIEVAAMTLGRKTMRFYRFETKDRQVDYYDEKGRSARKALLRTPIDGARMSSRFGMRRHPILGYNKMHRGLDFAAPKGTPIFAAGNGIVEKAYRYGAYGKYVRIRHNDTYKTAYAHLSRYGKNIRSGRRVKQGQVIGYVGTTGRSTGAHLHYEVLKNGTRVSPRSIKLPTGRKLAGAELKNFSERLQELEQQYATLSSKTQLAKSGKTP